MERLQSRRAAPSSPPMSIGASSRWAGMQRLHRGAGSEFPRIASSGARAIRNVSWRRAVVKRVTREDRRSPLEVQPLEPAIERPTADTQQLRGLGLVAAGFA